MAILSHPAGTARGLAHTLLRLIIVCALPLALHGDDLQRAGAADLARRPSTPGADRARRSAGEHARYGVTDIDGRGMAAYIRYTVTDMAQPQWLNNVDVPPIA